MKCEECTTNALEEFLDGELDAPRAAETEAHLAACRACALRYDELLDEQAIYASYERDLDATPQEALWAGVAARIAAEPPRPESHAGAGFLYRVRARLASLLVVPRFSPAMTAAMMLLAIGATAAVMRYMNSQPVAPSGLASGSQPTVVATPTDIVRQPTPEPTPIVATPAPQNGAPKVDANAQPNGREKNRTPEPQRKRDAERKPVVPASDPAQLLAAGQGGEILRRQRATERLVREAESKYLAAIRMLSEDVNRKRTRLDPQVAARFDETLATIDRSIAETRRTVLRQRNDPVAVQYMLSAYAKKIEVMREMAALD
ncbi:MAG TPA: zf-HC2 domain-containing protein [Pyrinomonadaceae bacterium]